MPQSLIVPPRPRLFTIGHSNHAIDQFVSLLARHGVTAVADVRSRPFSRFVPHFNRERLAASLKEAGINYVFLGVELGARRTEPEAYRGKQAAYDLVRQLPSFTEGVQRLRNGVASETIALMCAEKDPLTCHRTILIGRSLRESMDIRHILADGSLESGEDAETRLVQMMGLPAHDLFHERQDLIAQAYDMQSDRIAFVA